MNKLVIAAVIAAVVGFGIGAFAFGTKDASAAPLGVQVISAINWNSGFALIVKKGGVLQLCPYGDTTPLKQYDCRTIPQ